MVNISKVEIPKETKKILYEQLANLFVANTRKSEFSKTLFELLSPTERIMLATRVGIISLLINNCSTYEISNVFKVSTATIARIQEQLNNKELPHLEKIFKRKKARENFLSTIETFLTLGFPGVASKKLRSKIRRDIESWRAGGS